MKTFSQKTADVQKKWWLIDADGLVLLAVQKAENVARRSDGYGIVNQQMLDSRLDQLRTRSAHVRRRCLLWLQQIREHQRRIG